MTPPPRFFLFIAISFFSFFAAAFAQPAARTTVSLLGDHTDVQTGQQFFLGLKISSAPHWHTYYKIPGDAGSATEIEWEKLPENITLGEWQWPAPVLFFQDTIRNFVYENDTVLLIPISVKNSAKTGEKITLNGTASWLECDDRSCVPQSQKVSVSFEIATTPKPANTDLFAAAHNALKTPPPPELTEFSSEKNDTAESQNSTVFEWQDWTPEIQEKFLDEGKLVYVDFTARWCATCQVNKHVYSDEKVRAAFLENGVILLRADWTKKNPLIAAELAKYGRGAIPFNVFLQKEKPPVPLSSALTAGHVLKKLDVALEKIADNDTDFLDENDTALPLQIAFGFLGGLILNLMPCVFPVLGLKIMNFVSQAGERRGKIVAHGLVFTGGVILSFWILAGILIFLRAQGMQLGWGFQMQEPKFVLAMAVLLLVFALNMTGVFEVGGRLVGVGAELTERSGLQGSFFSGVLATIIATPCAAPFLAPALGAALALPPVPSLLIFTAVGLGLSVPYLLLSIMPKLLEILPRPGAWMESFKQGLSFLLFATVLYLLWIIAAQAEAVSLQIFLGMVIIALACWIYGRWGAIHRKKKTRRAGIITAAILFCATCVFFFVILGNMDKNV